MNGRLTSVDWLRGLAIALMTVDHASVVFDSNHLSTDSWAMYQGQELPLAAFLTRWVTHLCAPTFVFLAGTSIALSTAARRARGVSEARIDRDLLTRGAVIALFDLTLVTWTWTALQPFYWLFQVLWAIGVAMMAMTLLRRVPAGILAGAALGFLALGELVTLPTWTSAWGSPPWVAFLLAVGFLGDPNGIGAVVIYPIVPWLAVMALGHVFGRGLVTAGASQRTIRRLVAWGLGALLCFVVVRGLNGYGNMNLPRADGSLAQWLHASKYPPSLSFTSMTLGAMALILAARMAFERRFRAPSDRHPLVVLGRVPMFFYLLHLPALIALRALTGIEPGERLWVVWSTAALVVAVLVPPCALYRRFKRAQRGWTRFV